MLFEIIYYDRGREEAVFWAASSAEEARQMFERSPTYALSDFVRIDRIREGWERE